MDLIELILDWWPLLLFGSACIVVPIWQSIAGVNRMITGSPIVPVSDKGHEREFFLVQNYADWADAQGFRFEGGYTYADTFMAAWKLDRINTYFLILFIPKSTKVVCSYSTVITETNMLDTIGMAGQQFPEAPGVYVQSFSKLDHAQLFEKHKEALDYITRSGGIALQQMPDRALVEQIHHGEAQQGAYIKTLPFWYLRGVSWFYVRRIVRHNKTIKEQHRRGTILFPGDRNYREFKPRD